MKFVDDLLSETLRHVNDSLPRRVIPLERLLKMDEACVETVGGGRHCFDKADLAKLASLLPSEIVEKLHLPFVFTKHHSMDDSVYFIRAVGSEPQAFQILMGLSHLPKSVDGYYTYKPLVSEFIRRYPTLATVGYI
ncbi:MAG: DUF61 family protein [Nitrososphaerota archaeon]